MRKNKKINNNNIEIKIIIIEEIITDIEIIIMAIMATIIAITKVIKKLEQKEHRIKECIYQQLLV